MSFYHCELADLDASEYEYWYGKEKEGSVATLFPGFRKMYMTQWLYLLHYLVVVVINYRVIWVFSFIYMCDFLQIVNIYKVIWTYLEDISFSIETVH